MILLKFIEKIAVNADEFFWANEQIPVDFIEEKSKMDYLKNSIFKFNSALIQAQKIGMGNASSIKELWNIYYNVLMDNPTDQKEVNFQKRLEVLLNNETATVVVEIPKEQVDDVVKALSAFLVETE